MSAEIDASQQDDEDDEPRVVWNLNPYVKVREDRTGEVVFVKRWPSEHDTRIASNMICWLGTNEGRPFREDAQSLIKKKAIPKEDAYLFVWSRNNVRRPHLNWGGIPRDMLTSRFNDEVENRTVQDIDLCDVETLERVVLWLGTDMGQAFIAACERNIDIKYERERQQRLSLLNISPKTIPK